MANRLKLTDAKLKATKAPPKGQLEFADSDCVGLRFVIGSTGKRRWIVRKRIAGKFRKVTLGDYPEIGLAQARKKAFEACADIQQGKKPNRPLQRSEKTVSALWTQYNEQRVADKRSAKEIRRTFNKYILPEFGKRPVDAISRSDVTRLIDDIAYGARPAPVMARLVAAQLSVFYNWVLPRVESVAFNPVTAASRPPAPKSRDRVLSEEELRSLWIASEKEPFPWQQSIKLMLLTAARRTEIFSAERSEFDILDRQWNLPASSAKNGKAVIVPLSPEAVEVILDCPKDQHSGKLFPSATNSKTGASGISKLVNRLRASIEQELGRPIPHWTLHDIRRTVATNLQRLGVRLEVTESILNHVSGSQSGIVGIYQRYDWMPEKREAMDLWSKDLMRICGKNVDQVAFG
jgi:integrase